MNIKYSIGLPAFKGRFLFEAITSVLNQTITDFELIIINDCSPDSIKEIVTRFNDKRIKYFENDTNIGSESVIKNWNKCLEKATGEYFILMGDDDVMEDNYLEEFNHLISQYPNLDVYHCRVKLIDENSEVYGLSPLCPQFESVYENIWHRINGYRLQFISDFVYKTNKLKKNNGFYELPLAWYSDDVSSYIAAEEKGIAYTEKPLLKFRKSPFSISSSGDPEKKLQAFTDFTKWLTLFLKKKPGESTDKIIYKSIIDFLPLYKKKSIVETLWESYKKESILKVFHWFRLRKQFDISAKEIILSVMKYFRHKTAKIVSK